MNEPGPLLASGRDTDIYEYGPDKVLRRARDGRSLEPEARIMQFVHEHGFPCPQVYDVGNHGGDLVMDRVDGPTMGQQLMKRPWTLRRYGRLLAQLHQRLHRIDAPEWLPQSPDNGSSLIHLDLHPLNVIMSPSGPIVIDWTNAARGEEPTDVADTWLLVACADPGAGFFATEVVLRFRTLFVDAFLASFDRAQVVARLRPLVEHRANDRNMKPEEVAAMWRLVEREERGVRG
jgi:tRNA A-37 threonylcarbamoyl transferase component Bud32